LVTRHEVPADILFPATGAVDGAKSVKWKSQGNQVTITLKGGGRTATYLGTKSSKGINTKAAPGTMSNNTGDSGTWYALNAPPPQPVERPVHPGACETDRGGESAGRPRAGPFAVTGPRNVRTPQGRVLGNTQSGRPAGKCHREQTADGPRGHRQG
jgi:hypothetical protein